MQEKLAKAFKSGFEKEAQAPTDPFNPEQQWNRYARDDGMHIGDAILPKAELALKDVGADWKKYDPGHQGQPMPKDVYVDMINKLETWKDNPDKRPEQLHDINTPWHQIHA